MEQIHRELLTEYYPKIQNQIRILWHKKFKKLFMPLRVDFDDFEGQALYEISDNIHTYNTEKDAAFLTFCSVIINNKMKTYATNLNRTKRIVNIVATSLNRPISEDDDTELINQIPDPACTETCIENAESDRNVVKILSVLPKRKRQIVDLTIRGFTPEEISVRTQMSLPYIKDVLNNLYQDEKIIRMVNYYIKELNKYDDN